MLTDMHLHSDFSDGLDDAEAMIRAAIRNGFESVCFTDHVRRDTPWIARYVDTLGELKHKYASRIRVGIGVEARITDYHGTLDIPDECMDNGDIEIVAAIHRIPTGGAPTLSRSETGGEALRGMWLKTLAGTMENPDIDRLAHPFSHVLRIGFSKNDDKLWGAVFRVFEGTSYGIEYNCKYDNSFVPESVWLDYRRRLVFGSDSHSTRDINERSPALKSAQAKLK